MTIDEAIARARAIWGSHRLISIRLRADGSVEVHLRPDGAATDLRERNLALHRLNADGSACCHADCFQLDLRR